MTRVALVGASGRTGRLVAEVIPEFPDALLTAAVVSPQSALLNQPVPHAVRGVNYSSEIDKAAASADVLIDFSKPEVSLDVARAGACHGKPCLIATTGHDAVQRAAIADAAHETAILLAANTSLGVYVTSQLVQLAAKLLGDAVDIEIVETHHRGKKDAPSGTAKALADSIRDVRPLKNQEHRNGARETDELGIAALRGGDVVGEHTVYFFGNGERIEITHRAADRRLFARGAIALAMKLIGKAPGLYRVPDFF